ncbi:MAG: asparagine--tRNA ligase [Chlamydiae bacterium]|nr:asparagine--tRNA ligase [Chlamydiota bacterium]
MRTKIKAILHSKSPIENTKVDVYGWVRTLRNQKNFAFIEINDGSTLANLQVVADGKIADFNKVEKLTTGASVKITGKVVKSPAAKQSYEVQAETIQILGECDAITYPLQKKGHSFEFLRSIAHLRPRTNTQGAVMRMRNSLAFAAHKFFQERGFNYIQTPIITGFDCEGAGEMFKVTTMDDFKDFSKDFFKKPTFLTVSGQLNVECFACALSDVYTFGPTFRAENSNTARHLAEFWMIEPEIAFADINDDMELAESFIKYVIKDSLQNNEEDLEFFDKFIEKGLIARLKHVLESPFQRISYTEAVEILLKSNKKFEFPVAWGKDLQSEHERFLTEEYFKKPTIVNNYPEIIKAFYMRRNDDNKTVAAMDILVPKIGEIIGGSQREERLPILEEKLEKMKLSKEDYWWYLELRKYGSVPHAGFGVGFERLTQFITGMENIRDVIPFPRFPGHATF